MHCDNCGKQISGESGFCRFCGVKVNNSNEEIKTNPAHNSSYLNRLFRKGRLNRRNFIIGMILAYLIWFIFVFIVGFILGYAHLYNDQLGNLISYGTYIFVIFYWISLEVRRLHDLGYSGWYFLANFIPIAGLVLYIYLIFVSGKKETNKYGEITKPKIDVYEIFGILNK